MLIFRRKGKGTPVDEKRLGDVIKDELRAYIKREELQAYMENIENDKRKKKLWDSLPAQKKIKVLKFVLEKKGERHVK